MKLYLILSWALALIASTHLLGSPSQWECEPISWEQTPDLTDGLFTATIQTRCSVFDNRPEGIAWLYEKLQEEYKKSEKYRIHEGPSPIQKGIHQGLLYDLTDKVSEDGNDLAIRQKVELWTDGKKELTYHTTSREIQATGTAAYLKHVWFRTQVAREQDHYQVLLQNHVEIEKPWFALSFLFKPMSASITEDKFEIARDRLIQHLLSQPQLNH